MKSLISSLKCIFMGFCSYDYSMLLLNIANFENNQPFRSVLIYSINIASKGAEGKITN